MKDYYKILGIKATASGEDIRARWIELMRKFHPDGATVEGTETKRLKEINQAYEVLKHSSARAHYDLQRAYQQKKRNLFLRRLILPPAILIVFLILGLTYLQRPRVAPMAESPAPSARGIIHTKTNPLSSLLPNEPKALNQTNRIKQINQTSEINQKNRITAIVQKTVPQEISQQKEIKQVAIFHPRVVPKVTAKAPSSSRPSKLKALNRTHQTHIFKDSKASPRVAKPETSITSQKTVPLTKQSKVPQKINVTNVVSQKKQTNKINETNQIAQLKQPPLAAKEEEVKQFFDHYRKRYAQRDIEGFLSLFSSEAVQNQRDGYGEIKKIYSDFFNQSLELRYQMKDTRIRIYQNAVEVSARYKVDQILKKGRKKKVWTGDIRWILIRDNDALKIRYLDFKPQKSR